MDIQKLKKAIALRHTLHDNPELSGEEVITKKLLMDFNNEYFKNYDDLKNYLRKYRGIVNDNYLKVQMKHYWKKNNDFDAVFITKDGHIYITEGIEDDITLLDDFSNISPNIIKNEN